MSRYDQRREVAEQKFQNAKFDPDDGRGSLDVLFNTILDRYTVEIDWYVEHARKLRRTSQLLRGCATIFAASVLILIDSGTSLFSEYIECLAGLGTLSAVLGGGLLYIDRSIPANRRRRARQIQTCSLARRLSRPGPLTLSYLR